MAYEIRYTDFTNKGSIVVEDKSINQDTSLDFPGKQSTAYGQAIAENFLHLLENFANNIEPARPVEGQLWYNTSAGKNQLEIYDGTTWVSAGGIKKESSEPLSTNSQTGDLWVDTKNQQLYLYNGVNWSLIGPETSGGTLTGVKSENILSTEDIEQTVFIIYLKDKPIVIISDTTFIPKRAISGFSRIDKGVTISENYDFYGNVEASKNLLIEIGKHTDGRPKYEKVLATNFIRNDEESFITNRFNIRSNNGIRIGEASQFDISLNNQAVELKQNVSGSSIDFILRNPLRYNTVLHINSDRKVGINNPAPEEELDLKGNLKISPKDDDILTGKIIVENTETSVDISSGSIVTDGGVGIAQDLFVGGLANVLTGLKATNIEPYSTLDIFPNEGIGNIGTITRKFNQINAFSINSDNIDVNNITVNGNIDGTATSAQRWTNPISLTFSGDISGSTGDFDGSSEVSDINLSISNEFIANKGQIFDVSSNDEILVNKVNTSDGVASGIHKVSKKDFLKTVPTIPIGSIMPFGGNTPPNGWLICDGSEVKKVDYNLLWQVIGYNFKDPLAMINDNVTYFALPDLRGRLPLGLDNMGVTGVANRVSTVNTIGDSGGNNEIYIKKENLPEHEHDLRGINGDQYYGIRTGTEENKGRDAIPLNYDTTTGAKVTQGLGNSGGIQSGGSVEVGDWINIGEEGNPVLVGDPINVMNPFLAINYIIYAGEQL